MALRQIPVRALFRPVRSRLPSRAFSADVEDDTAHEEPLYQGHLPTNLLQKAILAAGSAAVALGDPWRADMVAVNAEVTGRRALTSMHRRMLQDPEGREILKDQPRINTKTVDFDALKSLPPNTLGHSYAAYCEEQKITPDSRDPVNFVDDPDLAYVMTRYREVHDLMHTVLDLPTNMVGEVGVKWVEALQTGLPMCTGGAIFGPGRFKTERQMREFRKIRPWVIRVGSEADFLMNVYFEKHWEQDLVEFRQERNIEPRPQ